MKSNFEKLGGTYRQEGDYLLPNVKAPESPAIGIWGQRRHKYLMEHNHTLYTALFLSGKLTTHLEEVDRVATKIYDRLVGMIEYAAETLSGIPSIIYGLFGSANLWTWIKVCWQAL